MALDIRLDEDNEKLLKLLMQNDREKTATGMVRILIREGLKARGIFPIMQRSHVESGMVPLEEIQR